MNFRLQPYHNAESAFQEGSQNPYIELNEHSQSRFNNILKQDSINFRAYLSIDYSRRFPQDEGDNFDVGNTINFWQASRHNQAIISNQSKQFCQQKQQLLNGEQNRKKGLKNLSHVILQLLRKNHYIINDLVSKCIDSVLEKDKLQSSDLFVRGNYQLQVNNIRRRIYDSINVMTAIGLVIKNNHSQLWIKETQSDKSSKIKPESETEIQKLMKKHQQKVYSIRNKKMVLEELKLKINSLKKHLERNKLEAFINQKIKSNMKNKRKIHFPLLAIGSRDDEIHIFCQSSRKQVNIKYKEEGFFIMSELDLLHILRQSQPTGHKVKPSFLQSQEMDQFDEKLKKLKSGKENENIDAEKSKSHFYIKMIGEQQSTKGVRCGKGEENQKTGKNEKLGQFKYEIPSIYISNSSCQENQ